MEISTDNIEADVSESVNGNHCAVHQAKPDSLSVSTKHEVCQMPATQKVKGVWCCERHKAEAYAGKYQ